MSKRQNKKNGKTSRFTRSGPSNGTVLSGYHRYPAPIKMPLSQQFRMQLSGAVGISTNSSGVIAGVLPCDPSVTLAAPFTATAMFAEWSNLLALFTQVKCIQLDVRIVPNQVDETKGTLDAVVAIAGNLQVTTTPSAISDLSDNPDCQLYPVLLDTAGVGRYHAIRHTNRLIFSSTASPNPSSSIYTGCPGGIAFYGSGLPVSTQLMNILYYGTYVFSTRS